MYNSILVVTDRGTCILKFAPLLKTPEEVLQRENEEGHDSTETIYVVEMPADYLPGDIEINVPFCSQLRWNEYTMDYELGHNIGPRTFMLSLGDLD